jgi:hypothetical protein
LPPIIPLVLSHGERGWHLPTSFEDTLELVSTQTFCVPSKAPPVEAIELLMRYALHLTDDSDRERVITVLSTIAQHDPSMR